MRKTNKLLLTESSNKKYNNQLDQAILLECILNSLPIGFSVMKENGEKVYSNNLYDLLLTKKYFFNEDVLVTDENQSFRVQQSNINLPGTLEGLKICSLLNISNEVKKQEEREIEFTMVAHDLKSPIYAQKLALETLLSGKLGQLSDQQEEIISMIYNSNIYSGVLVGNILSTYKLGNNNFNLNIEIFDLSELLTSCKCIIKYLLVDKDISIKIISPKTCIINGDRVEIQRAIMNLLVNAIKYAEKTSEIKVILDVRNNIVTFTVQNIGPYIADENIKKIFNKNFSIAKKGKKLGTGLGLYLTKKIIKLHDGKMIAKSFKSGVNIFGFIIKNNFTPSQSPVLSDNNEYC